MTVDEANRILQEAELLADSLQVTTAIKAMAAAITERLSDARPVLLCVMNGGVIFSGQLLPSLSFPLEFHYIHATRYGSGFTGGGLNWIYRPDIALAGRTVLLLDDILDEGITLAAITEWCREQGAAEVLTAVLVDKQHDRKVIPGFRADFTGIETCDRFLFGYGLDYRGYWRNAPGIYAITGQIPAER